MDTDLEDMSQFNYNEQFKILLMLKITVIQVVFCT